jgi:hypothetical protein
MAVEEEESFSAVAMECVAVKNERSSVVVAAPGALQGGGNGDGWTTGKHRNADAVCVSRKRERRHRFNPAGASIGGGGWGFLPYLTRSAADRCNYAALRVR